MDLSTSQTTATAIATRIAKRSPTAAVSTASACPRCPLTASMIGRKGRNDATAGGPLPSSVAVTPALRPTKPSPRQ